MKLKQAIEALGVAVRWRRPPNEMERASEKKGHKIVHLPMPMDSALHDSFLSTQP